MSLDGKIRYAGLTDVGKVRGHNEDCLIADSGLGLFLVCDGMGGAKAGEVASQMAASVISIALSNAVQQPDSDREGGRELLSSAISHANTEVYTASIAQDRLTGMGTTAVAVLLSQSVASIAHVGDSRAYRLRANQLQLLTRDHSLRQDLIDRGYFDDAQEAEGEVSGNIITRALGTDPDVKVDTSEHRCEAGDVYLLCSDGLSDLVSDDAIMEVLQAEPDLQQACQALVALANANGGVDNISVVLVATDKPFGTPVAWRRSWFKRLFNAKAPD